MFKAASSFCRLEKSPISVLMLGAAIARNAPPARGVSPPGEPCTWLTAAAAAGASIDGETAGTAVACSPAADADDDSGTAGRDCGNCTGGGLEAYTGRVPAEADGGKAGTGAGAWSEGTAAGLGGTGGGVRAAGCQGAGCGAAGTSGGMFQLVCSVLTSRPSFSNSCTGRKEGARAISYR